ncbi:MAG: sensor histidine kinase, partial [Gemmatimonadota bacterium]
LAAAVESRALLIRGFSHDLKNPLSAADGYLELLAETGDAIFSDAQRHYIRRARRSIDAAHRLADNLVTLARVEAGQLPIERTPTDLCQVARDAAEDYRGDADMAGLRLDIELPPVCPRIASDPARITQILSNLLSNAIRYTPSGGAITVRVAVREDARAPGPGRWVCVDVSDTGPGIPREQHETIFREFARAVEPGLAPGGAGLGLAIGRRLARLLGGELDLESAPGRGSTFTLWLPRRAHHVATRGPGVGGAGPRRPAA